MVDSKKAGYVKIPMTDRWPSQTTKIAQRNATNATLVNVLLSQLGERKMLNQNNTEPTSDLGCPSSWENKKRQMKKSNKSLAVLPNQ